MKKYECVICGKPFWMTEDFPNPKNLCSGCFEKAPVCDIHNIKKELWVYDDEHQCWVCPACEYEADKKMLNEEALNKSHLKNEYEGDTSTNWNGNLDDVPF